MPQELSETSDQVMLSAWQAELNAIGNRNLRQQCQQQEGELLPRFAEHYQQLKTLPRRLRRSLQRHWKRSLAGVALLMALGQAPAIAATINVGGACTLVRAINAANNGTRANGRCAKGSGADRIVLPTNSTQTLTAVDNDDNGLPVIRSTITLVGNNSTIRRAPTAPEFRIVAVAETGNLTLNRLTLTGGSADNSGGGVRNDGNTTIHRSTISGNAAAFDGGGVLNRGNTVIHSSTISDNIAGERGGGLVNFSNGTLTINKSTLSGNTAHDFEGGGLFIAYSYDAGSSRVKVPSRVMRPALAAA